MGLERTYKEPVKGYTKIPNCLYDMQLEKKSDAIVVYCFLRRRRNNQTGQCYPSLRDIAEHVGMSERQVTRVLHILESKNMIRVSRLRGHSNHYEIGRYQEWNWLQETRERKTKVLTNSQMRVDSRAPP